MQRILRLTSLALSIGASAQAQVTATLRGVVRSADSAAVSMAQVELVKVGSRTTDTSGSFLFGDVVPGVYELRVRRLGFEPLNDTIFVGVRDTAPRLFALAQLAEMLPTMMVRGDMVSVPKGFEDIYRRGSHSFGYFMTAEQIETRNPQATRDLLVGIPGIRPNGRTLVFERCRAPAHQLSGSMEGLPQVYIDGQRVTRFDDGSGEELEQVLRYVEPRAIQAIEIYTGLSQIPGDFAAQACAAVAIWTKHE